MSSAHEPLVSVVIPTYEGEAFLGPAIESVLAQTWPNTEVVVVDDGSTDRSAEIADSHPVRLVRQENAGPAAARNRGVEESAGELLAFLDQDDLFRPDKLERQIEALRKQPEAGMSSCRVRIFVEPGCRPDWVEPHLLDQDIQTLHASTVLVWRETFERVGPFDEAYQWGNDADWFMRARETGVPLARVDEALLLYRVHEGNESARVGATVLNDTMAAFRASVRRRKARAAGD